MIKHFISLCLLGLLLVLAQGTATAAGKWRIHPSYVGTGIQNIVDAGDKVYYLVSNNLYCLDKSTGENQSLNKVNSLNDASITGIYYNDYKHYLMIAYADANIDVITSNGRVVNLPDIMAASLTSTKAINDITFTAGGDALVATTFGYVVYNDTKWEVKESHIYNTSISSAAVVGDYVLLSAGSNIYYGKAGTHYETLGSMMSTGDNDNGRIYPIADNKFMLLTGWTFEYTVTPNPDGTLAFASATIVENMTDNLHRTPQGYLGNCMGSQFYYTLDDSGTLQSKVDGGTAMYSACSDGDGTLWSVTPRGLHSAADTASYYMPDAITTATPYWLRYDTRNNLLYVTSTGTNSLITEQRLPTAVNTYDGNSWTNVTPRPAIDGGGTYYPVFLPGDKTSYLMGSWWSGIYKITGRTVAYDYNWSNSPLELIINYYCHATIDIDRHGNLWAAQTGPAPGSNVYVLPSNKLSQATTTRSDWLKVDIPNLQGSKRARWLMLKSSDIMLYADGEFGGNLTFINNGGTLSSTVTSRSYSNLIDQDGTTYSWNNICSMAEDNNGAVWVGTTNGVVSLNPSAAFSTGFAVNHIKVPRNDGTTLADYLLDGLQVNAIAVDGANRKWLGTDASGLFLVSSDGSSIIQSFNTSNSPLLSNKVYDIACDPNSNAVYVTTAGGLQEYQSDSAPSQYDFNDIHAYPNPVRPDYLGEITVTGLMENSLVKIADASGNVVRQLKSTGGTATWNGRDDSGERVKSGVYYIMGSSSDSSTGKGGVCKLLIMR